MPGRSPLTAFETICWGDVPLTADAISSSASTPAEAPAMRRSFFLCRMKSSPAALSDNSRN